MTTTTTDEEQPSVKPLQPLSNDNPIGQGFDGRVSITSPQGQAAAGIQPSKAGLPPIDPTLASSPLAGSYTLSGPGQPMGLEPAQSASYPLGKTPQQQIPNAFQGLEVMSASANPKVNTLRELESQNGLPANFMPTMWQIESSSGQDPSMNDGTYVGDFQLGPQFDVDRTDFYASAQAAAEFAKSNAASLYRVLGRQPTGAELYLAHQQGPAGAAALLTHPDEKAVDVLARFHGDTATQVVTGNGGSPDMTARQFTDMWRRSYERKAATAARVQGWSSDTYAVGTPQAQPATPLTFTGLGGTSRFNPATGMIETV